MLEDMMMKRSITKSNRASLSPSRTLELNFPYSSRHSENNTSLGHWDKGWETDDKLNLHSTVDI